MITVYASLTGKELICFPCYRRGLLLVVPLTSSRLFRGRGSSFPQVTRLQLPPIHPTAQNKDDDECDAGKIVRKHLMQVMAARGLNCGEEMLHLNFIIGVT